MTHLNEDSSSACNAMVSNIHTTNFSIYLVVDARHIGGIESHLCVLSQSLLQRGQVVTVVLWQHYQPSPFVQRLQSLALPYLELSGSVWQRLKQLQQLAQQGVLHSHGYKAGLLCRLCAYAVGRRSVHTLHAGEAGNGKVRYYHLADRISSGLSYSMAVSQQIAQQAPKNIPVIKNFVLPTMAQSSTANNEAHRYQPQQPRRIGFIGRYCSDKGLDRFIALAYRLPQFSWHSFGQGPAQSLLASSAVQNHGFYEDIHLIWPQIDILVIPSRYEGLPMVALEALAVGIPVIGYDVGDLAAVVDDKVGALVTRNNQTALAQAILKVARYSDDQLQQLSQQAATRIQNEWHGQETIALCMAYYQQCRQP